jgi:hypothetical protein
MRTYCLDVCWSVLGVLLVSAGILAADDNPKGNSKGSSTSSSAYVLGQMRLLFDSWDLNRDGYVDRAELARAFRGPGARPYAGTQPAVKVQAKYPDHAFMLQVDQDRDGKISQSEFEDWARGYLQEQRKLRGKQRRVSQMEKKLAMTTDAAEKKSLSLALESEKKSLAEMKKEMHSIDIVEKHLARRKIKRS